MSDLVFELREKLGDILIVVGLIIGIGVLLLPVYMAVKYSAWYLLLLPLSSPLGIIVLIGFIFLGIYIAWGKQGVRYFNSL